MTDTAPFGWISRFESLGANCEFGFVLRQCGIEGSALFRWSEMFSIATVTALIARDFSGIYEWDHLAPFNAGMLLDHGCGMAWHSLIKSEIITPGAPAEAGNFRFLASEAERRRIWSIESKRMAFLAGKLRAELAAGGRIYVYRPSIYETLSGDALAALFAALNRGARNALLAVTVAGAGDEPGTLKVLQPGLMHGVIDRFAPGNRAGDVSLRGWVYLCRAALAAVAG
jgi:hypothetical protein